MSPALTRILSVAVGAACLAGAAFLPEEYGAPLVAAGLGLLSFAGYPLVRGKRPDGSPKGPDLPKS